MVTILNCYLYAKKVMALCLRVQFFWPSLYLKNFGVCGSIPYNKQTEVVGLVKLQRTSKLIVSFLLLTFRRIQN